MSAGRPDAEVEMNEQLVRALLNEQHPDLATLDRAKAWAVLFATVLLDSGLINSPRHAVMGAKAFERINEDG
jgi:hypothetical protein